MDPDVALQELLEAIETKGEVSRSDNEKIYDRAESLLLWLEKGGFLPTLEDTPFAGMTRCGLTSVLKLMMDIAR